MRDQQAVLAGDAAGYVWFDDPCPTMDAVITIARSLQALSRCVGVQASA
jgi:hypothetical protein